MNGDRAHSPQPRSESTPVLLVAGLTVLALLLRFARLGAWGFDSDEIFMLRDSIRVRLTNPRPLLYHLNHYFVAPVLPLDEFGLRFLPALFGALAIPVFYFVARRLVGSRAALLGAFLLALAPTHVIYSQFGRYWSLVFLLSAVYPYALYLGIRDRHRGMIALGVVTAILATLAHPAAVLLVGGPMLWMMWRYLRPQYIKAAWSHPAIRWGAIASLLIVVARGPAIHPDSAGMDRRARRESGQRTVPAPCTAEAAEAADLHPRLHRELDHPGHAGRRRWGSTFSGSAIGRSRPSWPRSFSSRSSSWPSSCSGPRSPPTTCSPRRPCCSSPPACSSTACSPWTGRSVPRWLVPAVIVLLILIPGTPTLVSQYLNGRKFDFKGVAEWLKPQLKQGDVIYSDQPVALHHYLPETDVGRLRYNIEPLEEAVRSVDKLGRGGALWIVAPAPAHAFRTNLKQGGLIRWIYDNCQLSNTVGNSRVDFRQQYLQVYRCRPAPR